MRHRRHRCPFPMRARLAMAAAGALFAGPAAAQGPDVSVDPFASVSMSTDDAIRMSTLLEVTIFRIDVLSLEVRIPPDAAPVLERLAGSGGDPRALGDSIAAAVLGAERLWARQEMVRNVGMGRFVDGITETVDRAVEAEWVSPEYRASLVRDLAEFFSFLEGRGARRGDEIFFEVRGDSVRTVYRAADGQVLMDNITTDPGARAASAPSFFAPGTRFREGLVESLLEGGTR